MSTKNKGILSIIISAFFFSLMGMMVRLSGDLPSIEKSFFRNIVAAFFAFFMLRKNNISLHIKKDQLAPLLVRSIFGTIGILCNFYAVSHMILADASILNKLSPFFAILFSFLFLKEKISPFALTCVCTAFLGSLFVIKPGIGAVNSTPAFIGMIGGMSAGIAYTFVRILGMKQVKGPFIVFFFSSFSCIVTLPYLLFNFHPMTLGQLCCLILAGIFACGGQFAVTAAYQYAPAKDISIYDYSQIIFSTILGFLFFGQIPDVLSFIGYAIIILSSVAMFFYNRKR